MTEQIHGPFYGERGAVTYCGDLIVCGLCGGTFKALGKHLNAVHGITSREYKLAMSLPLGTALISPKLRELLSRTSIFNDPAQNTGRAVANALGLTPTVCAKRAANVRSGRRPDRVYLELYIRRPRRAIRVCAICGREFNSPHKRKTCSDSCESQQQRESHLGQPAWNKAPQNCEVCGVEFWPRAQCRPRCPIHRRGAPA